MYTYGTRQLGDAGNGQFHILAGCHNQVTELVDNDYDVRHELMPLFRIQTTVDELLVILLDIAHMGSFQQVIASIHLHTDRVQGLHHLRDVCNDGIFPVGQFREEVMLNHGVDAEFYLLGVYQHKLQLCRMLLI